MRMLKPVVAGVCLLAFCHAATADVVMLEDFEDATVNYTTSVPEFTDNAYDYFNRTDGSDNFASFNGVGGSFYFGAQDIDGEGASPPLTMDFSVNIAGFTNLSFSGLFAEDDASNDLEDWDATADYVRINAQIDGGAVQELVWFAGELASDNTPLTNGVPALDTNFDGIGDGTPLTDTFTGFSSAIAGTGTTLDLQITFQLNAGDEDIALDNITITGDRDANPVPVPAAAWMGLTTLFGLGAFGSIRKRLFGS